MKVSVQLPFSPYEAGNNPASIMVLHYSTAYLGGGDVTVLQLTHSLPEK